MTILIHFSFAFTPGLMKRLGPKGGLVINRLTAFLVFFVGLQILTGGVTTLIK
jgi:multiple antibiotic resistance protein